MCFESMGFHLFAYVLFHRWASYHSSISQAALNWGKKNDPVYIIEEKGVIGLNFQSKEAQLPDQVNGYCDVRSFVTLYFIY